MSDTKAENAISEDAGIFDYTVFYRVALFPSPAPAQFPDGSFHKGRFDCRASSPTEACEKTKAFVDERYPDRIRDPKAVKELAMKLGRDNSGHLKHEYFEVEGFETEGCC